MGDIIDTPNSIGFIMDGNRRWARAKGMPTFEGHRRGGEVFSKCVEWVRDAGIAHAVFYAFSTENWNRSKDEVSYLMDLFHENLDALEKRMNDNDSGKKSDRKIRIRIIGRREDFAEDLQKQMTELEERSLQYKDAATTIWVALSYGGRAEIIEAANKAVEAGEKVTEETFQNLLWTREMPDPDLIIRTSGEQRLSNFVTWKSVYSELFFTKTFWPDFSQKEFEKIVEDYMTRQRRRGL